MLNPVGSLSPKIYWRRRVVAGVGLFLAVLLLWALFSGGNDAKTTKPVAAAQASTTSPASAVAHSASPSASPSKSGHAEVRGLGAAAQLENGEVRSPSGTNQPTNSAKSSASPTPPPSPTTCPDKALQVVAGTSQPKYPARAEPLLKLEIQNISDRPCFRDVGSKAQELVVSQGDKRMWSSDDCFTSNESDVRTLQPKQKAEFTLKWSGLTSAPGCVTSHRTRVGPGEYTVVARLNQVKSKAAKFSMA